MLFHRGMLTPTPAWACRAFGVSIPSKTTFYVYNCGGNVTRIVSRDETGGGTQNMTAGGRAVAEQQRRSATFVGDDTQRMGVAVGTPEAYGLAGTFEAKVIGGDTVSPEGFGDNAAAPEGFGGDRSPRFAGDSGCGSGSTQYTAVRFGYAKNGRTVTYAHGEKWCNADGLGCQDAGSYEVTWAKEFRYDGARQRYLERELDPDDLERDIITEISRTVTDYDGDEPYLSWVHPSGESPTFTGYELGIARIDDPTGTPSTNYYHTDMLGTTRFLTDDAGASVGAASYTAFGELTTGTSDRFGYVGAYGYQTHDEMPYLHVGARYYDPSTGRFLQRDPIGIADGSNMYAYVRSNPAGLVDPFGLKAGDIIIEIGVYVAAVGGLVFLIPHPATKSAGGIMMAVGCVTMGGGTALNRRRRSRRSNRRGYNQLHSSFGHLNGGALGDQLGGPFVRPPGLRLVRS